MSIEIKQLNSTSEAFWKEMEQLLAWDTESDTQIFSTVSDILSSVRKRGDEAVIELTARFDDLKVSQMAELELPAKALKQAYEGLPDDQKAALKVAVDRIRRYAEKQVMTSWEYTEEDGTVLGQQVMPLDRVGLYVPGGKAAYPSSVLMNAIPA